MNADDRKELAEQARLDGRRLFNVSEWLYTILIIMNCILALGGLVAGFAAMSVGDFGVWIGFFLWVLTAMICTFNYFVAVLSTHTTKVLTHTSLATVALMESRYESAASSGESPVVR